MQTERSGMVQELDEIYTALYKDEPSDAYDLAGAREWWNQVPLAQLSCELAAARIKLAKKK